MKQPLRVMVMTTVPITLSAFFQKQLRSLSEEEGFEVHAVSSPGPILDNLDVGPLVIRHGLAMQRQPRPLDDLKSLWNIVRLMRRIRPHIVHAHTPKAGMLGMLAAKIARVPVRLYTVHGLPLETRTGVLRKILEAAERASSNWSTQVYAVSRSIQQILLDLKLCPPEKLSVLGDGSCSGVDIEVFHPAAGSVEAQAVRKANNIPVDATVAVFIGRLSKDKGVEVLATAWRDLAERLPALHLLIAGEVDHTDPISLAALETLKTHPRIHLLGTVHPSNIPALYAAADFCVLPTFREGLNQVALESSAMATPVVSCQVCGVVDAVLNNVTGLLVPARDHAALAAAMAKLATDPALRLTLGAAAQQFVTTHFAAKRVNQLWMCEYRRLVRESFPDMTKSAIHVES